MGADMIAVVFQVQELTDLKVLKQEMLDGCSRISEETFFNLNDEIYFYQEDVEELTDEGRTLILQELIEEGFSWLNSRQVTWHKIPGYTLFITGGLSCGDYPTEACAPLSFLACIQELIHDSYFEVLPVD